MTTYNTYQEAKIANPESNIYIHTGEFWCEKSISPSSWTYESRGFKLCNPADYCMTVEKFLADGHKFVKGDIYMCKFGDVNVAGDKFSPAELNKPDYQDALRYTLRAAALEEKLKMDNSIKYAARKQFDEILKMTPINQRPHTRVKHVKCGFRTKWEYVKLMEDEYVSLFFLSDGDFVEVATPELAIEKLKAGHELYRQTETSTTEREVFVEAAIHELKSGMSDIDYAKALFDSGKFKLVNHDSDFLRSRIRAVAEWEMNTSNNHDWESVAESIYCAVDDLLKS